jgi:hypothetical protein
MNTKMDALIANDKETWAELSRLAGDILPSNGLILDNMFLLAQMRCKYITIAKRVEVRDDLIKRGILRDTEPITILEKLVAAEAKNFAVATIKDMVKEFSEVVLVCYEDRIRRRVYMKAAEQLRGVLDMKRCSIPRMELYTVGGVHILFATTEDYYEPPNEKACFRIINYDI